MPILRDRLRQARIWCRNRFDALFNRPQTPHEETQEMQPDGQQPQLTLSESHQRATSRLIIYGQGVSCELMLLALETWANELANEQQSRQEVERVSRF